MTSRYDKKTNTLTLTIPDLIMLPVWSDDVEANKVAKQDSAHGQMVRYKKSSPKKATRKKSPSRRTGK